MDNIDYSPHPCGKLKTIANHIISSFRHAANRAEMPNQTPESANLKQKRRTSL